MVQQDGPEYPGNELMGSYVMVLKGDIEHWQESQSQNAAGQPRSGSYWRNI